MQYAGLIKNDIAAGEGVNVSFFTQGCPFHCKGCHNPQTWDFAGGKEFTPETLEDIIQSISANGVQRNFSIMGGEPLCPENIFLVSMIILKVREIYPDIKIYLWTGYTYEELLTRLEPKIQVILDNIDYLIDGPFILEQRDITLPMRGSANQRILNMKELRNNEH
jgi:anaerobic ribonucleoside-triphosphate reductase activating protein